MGGADVYLAASNRVPHLRRSDLDSSVLRGDLRVLPAIRGCIHLVPGSQASDCLKIAELHSRHRVEREQERAGIDPAELDELTSEVLSLLKARGPMTTDALRKALPPGAVRFLGETGKRVGISSTLPPALRRLEFAGEIVRSFDGGRLDTERYLWSVAETAAPTEGLSDEPLQLYARAARTFFQAAGLASIKDFAEWAGLGIRDARSVLAGVDLREADIESEEDAYFQLTDSPVSASRRHIDEVVAFLPFEDNLLALHGGPAFFTDREHHGIIVPTWGSGRPARIGDTKHMYLRSIIANARLAGVWEFDPDRHEIVKVLFGPLPSHLADRIESEAQRLSTFLTEEIGHARCHALDTVDALRSRVETIRNLSS